MQKQLKKAFSTIINLPKISSCKSLNNNLNSINDSNFESKKETFLTITTDDIGFALGQNFVIDKKIENIKEFNSKPWETATNNNIYSPLWESNKNLLKQVKNKIKLEPNKFNSFAIKSHKRYFGPETQNIFKSYSTSKNLKFKDELKKKYSSLNPNVRGIISNIRKICYNNFVLDLLKDERIKINEKEIGYQKALKYENKVLNNDIKNFENYKSQEKEKLKKRETELIRAINDNSGLFEIMKQKLQEHRIIIGDIKKVLKNIIKFKGYGLFLYKILGFDYKDLERCNLGENKIKSNTLSEPEINQIIKKIFSQIKILFDTSYEELVEDLNHDPLKIYTIIKSKEKIILKLMTEKDNITYDINSNIQEYKKELQNYQNKYDIYMSEYLVYLEEFEKESKKLDLIEPNQKILDFHNYLIDLFYELKNFLYKDEKQKTFNKDDFLIYSNLVIPTIKELKSKELYINKLMEEMEYYELHDNKLFSKIINIRKKENKMKKINEEKRLLALKDNERNAKILNKYNQIIITGKYKYKMPFPIKKINSLSNLYRIKK